MTELNNIKRVFEPKNKIGAKLNLSHKQIIVSCGRQNAKVTGIFF